MAIGATNTQSNPYFIIYTLYTLNTLTFGPLKHLKQLRGLYLKRLHLP